MEAAAGVDGAGQHGVIRAGRDLPSRPPWRSSAAAERLWSGCGAFARGGVDWSSVRQRIVTALPSVDLRLSEETATEDTGGG